MKSTLRVPKKYELEEESDGVIDDKDIRNHAIGNVMLFLSCVVYPVGEGVFSIFFLANLVGNTTSISCLAPDPQILSNVPYQYDPASPLKSILLHQGATDVSKNFNILQSLTLACCIFTTSCFVVNFYYYQLLKIE